MNLDEAAGLDAEIAEKVMGWEFIEGFAATMSGPVWCQGEDSYLAVEDWNPQTNIYDAWMVVEKMTEKSHKARFALMLFSDGWYAKFATTEPLEVTRWQATQLETAPEAICRAALEAVGSQS